MIDKLANLSGGWALLRCHMVESSGQSGSEQAGELHTRRKVLATLTPPPAAQLPLHTCLPPLPLSHFQNLQSGRAAAQVYSVAHAFPTYAGEVPLTGRWQHAEQCLENSRSCIPTFGSTDN